MIKIGWDWNKAIPVWHWVRLSADGFPGWEMSGEEPVNVRLHMTKDAERSTPSHRLATKLDDVAEGHFYWRDFTSSGLPFVDDGDGYVSQFWFEKYSDAVKLTELASGDF